MAGPAEPGRPGGAEAVARWSPWARRAAPRPTGSVRGRPRGPQSVQTIPLRKAVNPSSLTVGWLLLSSAMPSMMKVFPLWVTTAPSSAERAPECLLTLTSASLAHVAAAVGDGAGALVGLGGLAVDARLPRGGEGAGIEGGELGVALNDRVDGGALVRQTDHVRLPELEL